MKLITKFVPTMKATTQQEETLQKKVERLERENRTMILALQMFMNATHDSDYMEAAIDFANETLKQFDNAK